ncbi:MAG: M15 family metallopeptidase [Clostridia bacterium]|nr:M15 family metallopeptidase [Clostridia bacterium]
MPPLHTTGGSVDLTITDLVTGKDLDFGIEFDDFSDLTNTSLYEKENLDGLVRDKRRLLYNIMVESGFTNLPSEVWHYDYGNRSWGYYKKKPAIYKGVFEINKIPSIINSFREFIEELKQDKNEISMELKKYQWDYSMALKDK